MLFPNPLSDWLEMMVKAAGVTMEDYASRILRSATLAQQMGPTWGFGDRLALRFAAIRLSKCKDDNSDKITGII